VSTLKYRGPTAWRRHNHWKLWASGGSFLRQVCFHNNEVTGQWTTQSSLGGMSSKDCLPWASKVEDCHKCRGVKERTKVMFCWEPSPRGGG
jgi:hypothetical protein